MMGKYSQIVVAAVLLSLFAFSSSLLHAQDDAIVATTRSFLDAYARGDRQKVLAAVDPEVVVYGSDLAEVFKGKDGVEKMLGNDMKLWNGSASIDDLRDISVARTKDCASMFFNASFHLGDRPPIPIRFAMLWQRKGRGWLLKQSSNAVPTQGQSAETILKGK